MRQVVKKLIFGLIFVLLILDYPLNLGIIRYIWEQFFGSDEIEHYTASYTWVANQVSHFMLGFCLMSFVWAVYVRGQPQVKGLLTARNRVFLPFAFVIIKDFVLDNLRDLQVSSGSPVGHGASWYNVELDAVTDDLFWCGGFCLAMTLIGWVVPAWFKLTDQSLDTLQNKNLPEVVLTRLQALKDKDKELKRADIESELAGLLSADEKDKLLNLILNHAVVHDEVRAKRWGLAFCICLVLLGGLSGLWLAQKDTFDQSEMPLNYTRLGPLTARLTFPPGQEQEQVRRLIQIRDEARGDSVSHVVLFHGTSRDRTDLAVSIGCEYAFQIRKWGVTGHRRVVYTTATRLLEDLKDADAASKILDGVRCLVVVDLDTSSTPLRSS